MKKTDEQLLKENGYEIICWNPFEIEMKNDDDPEAGPLGTATGQCAWNILRKLRKKDGKLKKIVAEKPFGLHTHTIAPGPEPIIAESYIRKRKDLSMAAPEKVTVLGSMRYDFENGEEIFTVTPSPEPDNKPQKFHAHLPNPKGEWVPKFVRMGDAIDGSRLKYRSESDDYYSKHGAWSTGYKIKDGKILAKGCMAKRVNGQVLHPITKVDYFSK